MVRVLKNEVTEGEREFFDAWLEESNDHKEEFASIALVWDQMGQAKVPQEPDADHMWVRIQHRINSTIQPQSVAALPIAKSTDMLLEDSEFVALSGVEAPNPERNTGLDSAHPDVDSPFRHPANASPSLAEHFVQVLSVLWWKPVRYAIAVVAVGAIAFGVFALRREAHVKEIAQTTQEASTARFGQEIVTTKGERATVSLVDGSTVHLNADSKLRIPKSYGIDTREVELEGEGYFAVQSNSAHPFRVNTGAAYTEVKGTEFNVRYRNDFLKVVVSRGLVRLMDRKRSHSVDLHKGELTSYAAAIGLSQPRKVDVKMHIAWRENKLAFAKTPLAAVMAEIELAYNVTIVVKNKNAFTHTLTGYFVRDSLDEVLSTIALAMDIKIKRDGQTVTVY